MYYTLYVYKIYSLIIYLEAEIDAIDATQAVDSLSD